MGEKRIVVIGDLNAADDVLIDILRGTRLIDRQLRWRGGATELVQLGDLFNRGGGAARALRLLLRLQREARRVGGRVCRSNRGSRLGKSRTCRGGPRCAAHWVREAAWDERCGACPSLT